MHKQFMLGAAAVFAAGVQGAWATGHQIHLIQLKETLSGSSFSVPIDTNGDKVPGSAGVLQGHSNLGPVQLQFFKELDIIRAAPSGKCKGNQVEAPLVESTKVQRFIDGDLMYLRTTREAFCANLLTGEFAFTETLTVIGGTGRYAKATGTLRGVGSGQILSSDRGLPVPGTVAGFTNFGSLGAAQQ